MSVLKKNIASSFVCNIWTGVIGIAFMPIYIHFLGIEAYGLMGIFSTLWAIFGLLDIGLSPTLTREMAHLLVYKEKTQEMRNLVRTLEVPYWMLGGVLGIIIIILSSIITSNWVNAESLSPKTVRTAIILMGISVIFQWPMSLYSGGLIGLQRQVLLNSLNGLMATLRGVGAVMVLWLISPTVEAFFLWQIIVSIIHIVLIVFSLWHCLPEAPCKASFRLEQLLNIWKFAAGMTWMALLSTILMQLDKIILSRILSLEKFGYYTLASSIGINLYRFINPIFSGVYPKLVGLVALGDTQEIIKLYHKSAQLMSVVIIPVAVVIALFSKEILLLWLQNPATVENTHLLVSILITGTAINGILNIPYALQLSFGMIKLGIIVNIISVIVMVPLLIIFTKYYGVIGSANVWIILNLGYLFISLPIMHQRLLPSEKWKWYFKDVALTFSVALFVAFVFRHMIPAPTDGLKLGIYIIMVSALTLGASALITPVTRNNIKIKFDTWRRNRYVG